MIPRDFRRASLRQDRRKTRGKVGRLREKQYQLAAQKQNEALLRCNYYREIAKYFERESEIARHYDSWNLKDSEPKQRLEKSRKAERLLARRNRLKQLLEKEQAEYERQIEEARARRRSAEAPTLEILKEKLKEKRAEQNLYFPRTCRRYQSYFVCPTEPAKHWHWSKLTDSNSQSSSRICRDATNLVRQTEKNSLSSSSRMESSEHEYPHAKYQARYAHRSLENTNVRDKRSDNLFEYTPSRDEGEKRPIAYPSFDHSLHENQPPLENKRTVIDVGEENHRADVSHGDASSSKARRVSLTDSEDLREQPASTSPVPRDARTPQDLKPEHRESRKSSPRPVDDSFKESSEVNFAGQQGLDQTDESLIKNTENMKDSNARDNQEFESEKSLPWLRLNPADKNLSKQMFLYLTHKELKHKIEDLDRRELHACMKHNWDDALRLRDMRNRLELIREKRLYSTDDLHLDEDVRKLGLANIEKRSEELAGREDACTDSSMYSEDAKDLWDKWVKEDEGSVIKDARLLRETLMNSLEKEWQNLAIRDKDKISRSFENVYSGSSLQEEHNLTAAISARMRSLSGPAK
ncbi:hypothetical protein KM043_000779 [Ampulex compressa]|nr:hypothetical protein KM043_000779 [Ampulex compressa]